MSVRSLRKAGEEVPFTMKIDDKVVVITNISESGCLFNIPANVSLPFIPDYKCSAQLFYQDCEIYSGQAVLVRQNENFAAVEFNPYLPEDFLEAIESINLLVEGSESRLTDYERLPAGFFKLISEYELYLRFLKEELDLIEKSSFIKPLESKLCYTKLTDVLVARSVAERLHQFSIKLHEMVAPMEGVERELAKAVFRDRLHQYYKTSSFVERSLVKPLGYTGDYVMMRQIYNQIPEGSPLFARVLFSWGVREPSSMSVQYRRKLFKKMITEQCQINTNPVIVSLACGPAQEVVDFLQSAKPEEANRVEFVFLDQDRQALLYAKRQVMKTQNEMGLSGNVYFLPISVKKIVMGDPDFVKVSNDFSVDLLYSAGLFDYLTDDVARALLQKLCRWSRKVIIGNFHPNNPSQTIGEFAGEWKLIHRSEQDLLRLASNLGKTRVFSDDSGIELFLEVKSA